MSSTIPRRDTDDDDEEEADEYGETAIPATGAGASVPRVVPPLPSELQGVTGAESIHECLLRGHAPDTIRFFRLIGRISSGLVARTKESASLAEGRIFAICTWMEAIQKDAGVKLWIARAYCAAIVIFHRCGFVEAAFRAYDGVRRLGEEVPVCNLALLIDLCLREERSERATELFEEARSATVNRQTSPDTSEAATGSPTFATEGMPSWVSSREGQLIALIAAHAAILGGLSVPLLSTTAAAAAWVPTAGGDVLSTSTDTLPVLARGLIGKGWEHITSAMQEGLDLIEAAVARGAAGPNEGLEQRVQSAKALLMRPCSMLCALRPTDTGATQLLAIIHASGVLATADTAPSGCVPSYVGKALEFQPPSRVAASQDVQNTSDIAVGLGALLGKLRSLSGQRRVCREDCEEVIRGLGRRKTTSVGPVLICFQAMEVLAVRGSRPVEQAFRVARLEQQKCAAGQAPVGPNGGCEVPAEPKSDGAEQSSVLREIGDVEKNDNPIPNGRARLMSSGDSLGDIPEDDANSKVGVDHYDAGLPDVSSWKWLDEPPNPHLTPDSDTCAALVEALFAAGDGEGAQRAFAECALPNPCAFSAMIFGSLAVKDGKQAADALLAMEAAGFLPHHRFIKRMLKSMGPYHEHGLRIIRKLAHGAAGARRALFHVLMEACANAPEPSEHALAVLDALRADGLEASLETQYALLRAISGFDDEAVAVSECQRVQTRGDLAPHPALQAVLRECYMFSDARKRSGVMESRRVWLRHVLHTCTGDDLRRLIEASEDFQQDASAKSDGSWLPLAYCAALQAAAAAVHTSQYLIWRYFLVRSADDRAVLQKQLDNLLAVDRRVKFAHDAQEQLDWDPYAIVLHVISSFRDLEVPESAQLRLVRMLFMAAAASPVASWSAGHVEQAESKASGLLPDVLTEVISKCPRAAEDAGDSSVFRSEESRRRLADLVRCRFIGRDKGEPVKLSTALRFIRVHSLTSLLDDETLLRPVLGAFCDGFVQHAYSLASEDSKLQQRLVCYAIKKNKRRAAGRLAERFGLSCQGAVKEAPEGWSVDEFAREVEACVREAEDAEEQELRKAKAQRIAAEDDTGCLQLPESMKERIFVVATEADLVAASAEFNLAPADAAFCDGVAPDLAHDFVLGLDVEWRPHLEKRGGMQKHRRSGAKMEPCSTLQVAAEDFVAIFDLLALAPAESKLSSRFSELLQSIFSDAGIVKLGFGFRHDFQRLASSYPHLDCFRRICSVVDVQEVYHRVEGGSNCSGLSALCGRYLGAPLSKRLQTSDWGARPLAQEQLEYASLDAFCLIGLARALQTTSCTLQSFVVQPSETGQLLARTVVAGNNSAADDAEKEADALDKQIAAKGAEIRLMKQSGAPKTTVQAEVAVLLQLKSQFKELTQLDWTPSAVPVQGAS